MNIIEFTQFLNVLSVIETSLVQMLISHNSYYSMPHTCNVLLVLVIIPLLLLPKVLFCAEKFFTPDTSIFSVVQPLIFTFDITTSFTFKTVIVMSEM